MEGTTPTKEAIIGTVHIMRGMPAMDTTITEVSMGITSTDHIDMHRITVAGIDGHISTRGDIA